MALASTEKVILGSIAFSIFWVLAVFPSVPFLPVGRTAGSLLGAMLMVIFRVITPDQAYDAIDLPILGLLFGTMVVSVYLEKADMFKHLGKLLTWKSKGAHDLLLRICLLSAISSALFTNDTSCVVLTEFVLKIARQHNLPPHPFLLALASSANIGSSATPIGNPQNLVIAVQSKISFGSFLVGILPAMLIGILVNALILLCMYWKVLSIQKDEEDAASEVVAEEDMSSHRFSPATMSHRTSLNSQEWNSRFEPMDIQSPPATVNRDANHVESLRNRLTSNENEIHQVLSSAPASARNSTASKETLHDGASQKKHETVPSKEGASVDGLNDVFPAKYSEGKETLASRYKRMLWKSRVYLVTIGMLISLLMGLNMSWTAITAALTLGVLDFKDAQPCLEKVSYCLLIFFCGMFITVDGFNRTEIPSTLWDWMEPHAKVNCASGIAVLAVVILVLSNVASNVPTVLLLGGQVAASTAAISAAEEKKSWLILAWVSTVRGNLSLLGSAANLIVCEQACRTPDLGYTLSFWNHLKFGVPSTIIVTAIDGAALGSRLGSGALTPDGAGLGSGLGSGCLTPNGVGPPSRDGDILLNKQISVEDGSVHEEPVVHHRISFELTSEDVARCLESKSATSIGLEYSQEIVAGSTTEGGRIQMDAENSCEKCIRESTDGKAEKAPGETGRGFCQKHCLNKLGSVKEFNFDNSDRNLHGHSAISSEWWANDNIAVKEAKLESRWSFLPFLQPEVS
ncbi:hypothetical protein NL676_016457 [Syzygium grande]|nr:hypothetical protein NL676_016457 [Syzygium grande]